MNLCKNAFEIEILIILKKNVVNQHSFFLGNIIEMKASYNNQSGEEPMDSILASDTSIENTNLTNSTFPSFISDNVKKDSLDNEDSHYFPKNIENNVSKNTSKTDIFQETAEGNNKL